MGCAFEFILLAGENEGAALLDDSVAEVRRIEYLLTEFSDTSVTSAINRAAGVNPVTVPEEVYGLLTRCKEISRLTQGAFDITAGVLKKLYNFKGDDFPFPDDATIRNTLKKTGIGRMVLSPPNRAYLTTPGMHIAFSAIGKGYAADCVKKMLQARGVEHGVINASGDLTAWGRRLDGTPWTVGIADPDAPDHAMAWIPVDNASVATSGDYEQFFLRNGERFSHTIDPKTGLPVKGIKSVTVVSPSAELSDALATAVYIMGPEAGLHLIGQLPATHALLVDAGNNVSLSRHLKLLGHETVEA